MPSIDKPVVGQDTGTWGAKVNAALDVLNNAIDTLTGRVDSIGTGGTGSVDPEGVRDTIATALRGLAGVTVTPDDNADTISVALTQGQFPLGSPQNPVRDVAALRPAYIPVDVKCYWEGQTPFNPPYALPVDEVIVLEQTDTAAPSIPPNFTATAGDARVDLAWGASVDAVSTTVRYKVYRDNAVIATITALSYADTGRPNGTAAAYKIGAIDDAGNEAQTATLTRTPSGTVTTTTLADINFDSGIGTWRAHPVVVNGVSTTFTNAPTHDTTVESGALRFTMNGEGHGSVENGTLTTNVPASAQVTVTFRIRNGTATSEDFIANIDLFSSGGGYEGYRGSGAVSIPANSDGTVTYTFTTTALTTQLRLGIQSTTTLTSGGVFHLLSARATTP